MLLKVYTNISIIPNLGVKWEKLLNLCWHQTPFYCWEFIYCWYLAFNNNKPIIITIEDNDANIILIAPLVLCDDGILRIAGYKRADYNIILYDKNKPEAFKYFLKWVTANRYNLELTNIHDSNKISTLFSFPFKANIHGWAGYQIRKYFLPVPFVIIKAKNDCPYISVSGSENIISAINESKSHKARIKLLEKSGTLKYKVVYNRNEVEKLLPQLFALHIAEWEAANETSLFNETPNTDFYYLLSRNMQQGLFRMDLLMLNEEIIAMHFGFEDNNVVYYYKPCYALKYKKNSAGSVLLNFIIKNTLEQKKEFDFLKGAEAYKNKYTTNLTRLININVKPSFLLSKLPQ